MPNERLRAPLTRTGTGSADAAKWASVDLKAGTSVGSADGRLIHATAGPVAAPFGLDET